MVFVDFEYGPGGPNRVMEAKRLLQGLKTIRVTLSYDEGLFLFTEPEERPHDQRECSEYARIKQIVRTDPVIREILPRLLAGGTHGEERTL